MDQLPSNPYLHDGRSALYRTPCHWLIGQQTRPVILVNWSDIVERERLRLIRAALVVEGRAIPLFESIMPLKKYKTHRKLLHQMKQRSPRHCHPITITDAGFRGPWFKAVEAMDRDWVGRIRNSINYRLL